jgi:hypothetical protein
MGRIKPKKKNAKSEASAIGGMVLLLIIVGMLVSTLVVPKIMNREVTLVSNEGHSLPFAAVVIHTKKSDRHKRTDLAGNIAIPRFTAKAITIKDPRYIEKTWQKSDIAPELIVERSLLGSSLDNIVEKLLQSAEE